ncbi:MAG: hypothetical protein RBU21_08710, partial [FCB group bacterium]|nr:hypothetical protein [FCB group bacterium]
MGSLGLIARSLRHYVRMHAGLFLGTALAAAILTGALVVGDSARESLRAQSLMRLGNIDCAVFAGDRLFSQELGPALAARLDGPVSSGLLLGGMVLHQDPSTGKSKQLNRVQVLGIQESFWRFRQGGVAALGMGEIAIDERVASALSIGAGDTLALRV